MNVDKYLKSIEDYLEYYKNETNRLTKLNETLKKEKLELLDQLKKALAVKSGEGFAS